MLFRMHNIYPSEEGLERLNMKKSTIFYAHSDPNNPNKLPDDPGSRWQSLREHLLLVARLSSSFARQMNPNDQVLYRSARWAGLLHDVGKYSDEFQRMLIESVRDGKKSRVKHAVHGAAYAADVKTYDIALAILGHHTGLHAASELQNKITVEETDKALRFLQERAYRLDRLSPLRSSKPPFTYTSKGEELELRIRMLFSCLIDADRTDCTRHARGCLPKNRTLNPSAHLEELLGYIEGRSRSAEPGKVNDARRRVLEFCLEAAQFPGRLLSLNVPTGGGKTLSAMAFALKRAILRPEEVRRIIVVIPYLSIIEQNAKVYANVMHGASIVEHHSGDFARLKSIGGRFIPTPESDAFTGEDNQLATENWNAPVVVTTSVRFFESLFSNHPTDLRRLHNIARSVIILDEIQTLPKGFLRTIQSMIRGLADDWCTTFVFCTATQPALEKPASVNEYDFRWTTGTIQPIIPPSSQRDLITDLKRVSDPIWPKRGEASPWEEIAEQVAAEERVLCIVNTKKHALELFNKLVSPKSDLDPSTIFHLSTRMCAMHRLAVLAKIRCTLRKENHPCRVVSTQLVEAGVDLDFPVVFRAMGPLDAVIQAAGRCDREGKLTALAGKPAGRLVVFRPEDNQSPYKKETQITEDLAEQGSLSIHNPDHIRMYFNRIYEGDRDPENIEGLRKKLDYPAVAERFAMINDRTKAIMVPFDSEARDLIERIEKTGGQDYDLLRQAQRYQVGLYSKEFDKAREYGTIVELWQGSDLWKCHPSCYLDSVGLVIKALEPEEYMA